MKLVYSIVYEMCPKLTYYMTGKSFRDNKDIEPITANDLQVLGRLATFVLFGPNLHRESYFG